MAPGETNLTQLLSGMSPVLHPDTYVFANTPEAPTDGALNGPGVVMAFHEQEGWTLVLTQEAAAAQALNGEFPCRMITLSIASALDAVGFMAAIASELAAKGISCNPVSAFHHDHLFVPEDRSGDAMAALNALSAKAR